MATETTHESLKAQYSNVLNGRTIAFPYDLVITRIDGTVETRGYDYLDQIFWYVWPSLKADPAVASLKVLHYGRKVYRGEWAAPVEAAAAAQAELAGGAA